MEFKSTEYGKATRVASEEVKNDIGKIGINKCARESGFDRKNFIRKLIRGIPVKRNPERCMCAALASPVDHCYPLVWDRCSRRRCSARFFFLFFATVF